MDLIHTFTVPVGIEETWQAFNDLAGIVPCFPGATLGEVNGDAFAGSVKVKLGPISLVYTGVGTFVERDQGLHRAVIEAKGKDKRGNGTASANVTATLVPDGDGTRVEVTTDLSITGKPAQFGRGVMQDVSDKLLNQFVACITDKLSGTTPAEEATEPPPPAAASDSHTEPVGTPPPGGPRQEAPSAAAPRQPTSEPASEPAEINMLKTVGPVMLKRYGPAVGVGLAVIIVVIAFVKGRKRSAGT